MNKRALFWQFFGAHTIILMCVIGLVLSLVLAAGHYVYRKLWIRELSHQASIIGSLLVDSGGMVSEAELTTMVSRLGANTERNRITIIRFDGKVIGETMTDPGSMASHQGRPEIREALEKGSGFVTRHSDTFNQTMLYFAYRVPQDGEAQAVVRVAVPVWKMEQEFRGSGLLFAALLVGVFAVALGLSYYAALRIVGPVSDLQEGAQRIGAGDWSHRIKVSSVPRLSEVARSINGMAECFEEQMRNVRRLETVRQDFVANVSHELRTPVTSIKGFTETLLDGAIHAPETAERFVKIIYRQSCQLESILKDLMELVRLEHDMEKKLDAPRIPLLPVLNGAVELCRERAAEHKAHIQVSCAEDIAVEAHSGFLEQALVNLINNAITYGVSPACARVDVTATRDSGGVMIQVRDYGAGIEKVHLERLFERFYRVDKGRSRGAGGTGLGLAIVKHIAAIHGGTVSVKSKIGRGTVFTLHLHESVRNPLS